MKDDTFLSKEEFVRRQKLIKSRQQRLIQARAKSKKMAASLLERAKRNATREYRETENRVLAEIRQHYSQELASVRQQYENCISEINEQHYAKMVGNFPKRKINDSSKTAQTIRNPPLDKKDIEAKKNEYFAKGSKELHQKENALNGKRCCKKLHKEPVTSSSDDKKKTAKEKGKLVDLPENIVIRSDDVNSNNVSFSKNKDIDSSSVISSSMCPKKTVIFKDRKNCNVPSLNVSKKTLPNVPKRAKFISNPNIVNYAASEMNHPNMFDAESVFQQMPEQQYTNKIYNELVHDRIRILEQKEKILSKRVPVIDSISVNPPVRFSEYFTGFRIQSSREKLKQSENSKKPSNIDCDLSRVKMKKKLLTLELTNAETQTESHIKSPSTPSQTSNSLSQSTPINDESCVSKAKQEELSKTCPSPIPKHNEEIFKRNPRCKRKHSRKSKGVMVTVVNNKTKISTNSAETDSSANYVTQSSIDRDKILIDDDDAAKSIKIIVNVLSNTECTKNIDKLLYKSREVTDSTSNAKSEKISRWRKLFENEEKLTESSYLSPPEAVSIHKCAKIANSEPPHDISYYIRKLLLMSPESIENLDVSSCSSTHIQETVEKMEQKRKIPVSIPLYQNSFDDTMDVVFDVSSDQNDSTLTQESSFGSDENGDLSSSAYLRKYVSSLSDSSVQEPEIVSETIDEVPKNLAQNLKSESEGTVNDSEGGNARLPSLDELLRRGFVWEPIMKTKADEEIETLEEDEFIEEMLKINIQPDVEKTNENVSPKSSENDQNIKEPSKAKNSLLNKNESRLFGWIGTTVQRTLEASAMNSTSSGESSDPVRKMNKTLENLVEEQQSHALTEQFFNIAC